MVRQFFVFVHRWAGLAMTLFSSSSASPAARSLFARSWTSGSTPSF